MALNLQKASPTALINAARALTEKKNYKEAASHLQEILRRDNGNAPALSLMGDIYARDIKTFERAIYFMVMAINADPSEHSYKERFVDAVRRVNVSSYIEPAERAVIECLKSADTLDCSRLRLFWVSHLMHIPDFHAAFNLAPRKSFAPENEKLFSAFTNFKPLFNPYFLLGIKYIVVGDAMFEEFLTHIRKHMLEDYAGSKRWFTSDQTETLAGALSHYNLSTDYMLDATPGEQQLVDCLRVKVGAGSYDAADIALLACYMPLHKLKNADRVLQDFSASEREIGHVVRAQIKDHQTLVSHATNVVSLTAIDGSAVSSKVQEQYEEFPYPRWNLVSEESLRGGWQKKNAHFTQGLHDKKINILIAGCGTGQESLMFATVFPQAEILAVDLSRASLAYAIKKAEEYKIKNVTFRHADLLRLDTLEQRFDIVNSCGVLHHLQDPLAGWRTLTGLLKPKGLMQVAFYSKIARRHILAAQRLAKEKGFVGTVESMKDFRRNATSLLPPDVLENISRFKDYYYLSMYRDLLFHVQEHDYDLRDINSMIKTLNLDFLGFSISNKQRLSYIEKNPDDLAMTNLEKWHAFEEKNPDTFREMYYIWCRKPD